MGIIRHELDAGRDHINAFLMAVSTSVFPFILYIWARTTEWYEFNPTLFKLIFLFIILAVFVYTYKENCEVYTEDEKDEY